SATFTRDSFGLPGIFPPGRATSAGVGGIVWASAGATAMVAPTAAASSRVCLAVMTSSRSVLLCGRDGYVLAPEEFDGRLDGAYVRAPASPNPSDANMMS